MSIKNVETALNFIEGNGKGQFFFGIIELGFTERGGFVISAHTTPFDGEGESRGTYLTCPPISPMEYRRKIKAEQGRETHTSYRREYGGQMSITDDWGSRYTFQCHKDVIDQLVAECIANEIPEAP